MRRLPSSARTLLVALSVALLVAVATGAYERVGGQPVRYEGVEPGWSVTRVTVAGWPMPYIYDKLCCSPVDRADWAGVLLRLDEFRPLPFVVDVAIFFAVFIAIAAATRRLRARG